MRRLGHDHLERSGSHLPDLTSPDMIGFRHRPAMSSAAVRLLSSPGIERAWAAALGYPLVQEGAGGTNLAGNWRLRISDCRANDRRSSPASIRQLDMINTRSTKSWKRLDGAPMDP